MNLTILKNCQNFEAIQEFNAIFPNYYDFAVDIQWLPVSNASARKSLSELKRIKNYIRLTLGSEKADVLSMYHNVQWKFWAYIMHGISRKKL